MGRLAGSLSAGGIELQQLSGSFWKGRAGVVFLTLPDGSRRRLENLSWQTLPGRLLHGEAATRLALADGEVSAQALVGFAGSRTTISGLQAALPAGLVSVFAPALTLLKPGGTI